MGMVWGWIVDGLARMAVVLKLAAAGIVGRVLATFGLTMVTFDTVLPNLKAFVLQYAGGLPPAAMEMAAAVGIGQAMSMVLSALTVRLAWKVFIVPTSVANAIGGSP